MVLLITTDEKLTESMKSYERETGKRAIWRGNVTESFKKWQRGEKIYFDDNERIVILIKENIKNEWLEFAAKNNISTISKLIRESVKFFMNFKSRNFDFENIASIIHHLKEPLTSLKGFSEILIEDYKHELSWEVLLKIKSIFDQSLILEGRIDDLAFNSIEGKEQFDILIVDDDAFTLKLLTDFFTKRGYSCVEALRGEIALDLLEKNEPKLILLDVLLPDINGYEICRKIKTNNRLKNIPVYFITAVTSSEVKKKVGETGAEGYFLKPFSLKDFKILFKYL
ncbi:MAG: Polar-differentiation response regulator DivK [Candidatus Anoxychlamydiales bacterium]|nr:Polar-differentiation response regulator DivK [Candidatus Anoxychlamydiales bacterium]